LNNVNSNNVLMRENISGSMRYISQYVLLKLVSNPRAIMVYVMEPKDKLNNYKYRISTKPSFRFLRFHKFQLELLPLETWE